MDILARPILPRSHSFAGNPSPSLAGIVSEARCRGGRRARAVLQRQCFFAIRQTADIGHCSCIINGILILLVFSVIVWTSQAAAKGQQRALHAAASSSSKQQQPHHHWQRSRRAHSPTATMLRAASVMRSARLMQQQQRGCCPPPVGRVASFASRPPVSARCDLAPLAHGHIQPPSVCTKCICTCQCT